MTRCASLLLACLLASGCGGCELAPTKPPGDEVIGTFAIHYQGIYSACSLTGFPITADFEGTLSRFADGGKAFFTASGVQYEATFDGQLATYGQKVTGQYGFADGGSCNACQMKQVDTAVVALLSPSQSKAVGDTCPVNALDGGVPAADEDAGIALPRRVDGGFDAVRVCGEVQVNITGEGFCDQGCYACKVVYRITGDRK